MILGAALLPGLLHVEMYESVSRQMDGSREGVCEDNRLSGTGSRAVKGRREL